MAKALGFGLLVFGTGLWLSGCGGGSSGPVPPDLSGSVGIETNTRVDGDTADEARLGLSVDNNTPATAQQLPANATVGGYLSFNDDTYDNPIGSYPNGPFDYSRDRTDLYVAELAEGDRISLQVFASPDLFLVTDIADPTRQIRVLKSDGGNLVDALPPVERTGDLNPMTVTLPTGFESGSYLIELSTSGGMPFRYVLSLADIASTTSLNARYSEPTFVIDQAVVQMAVPAAPRAMASSVGVVRQQSLGNGTWLMKRNSSAVRILSDQAEPDQRKSTLGWIRSLRKQPGVVSAEPDYIYTAQAVAPDNDDFFSRQWNLTLMQTRLAWQVAPNNGSGVGIAVLDTGLFSSSPSSRGAWHPDLDANVRLVTETDPEPNMDFVTGDRDIDGTAGRDTNPADPGDGRSRSSNFHGTHVAGIAAAVDNDIGIVGVAPEALIYPLRVLGKEGVGSSSDLIAAINWAAGRDEIDVLNLSLGGLGNSEALRNAINAAWDGGNGKLIVAAAGNAATSDATFPAAYDNVIGVGAVDGAGVLAGYSNTGPSVNVVAPGGDASRDADQDGFADLVVSTYGTDEGGSFVANYASLQGTSMAAPHVAGVYALMKGEVPTLTPVQFLAFLRGGSLTRPLAPTSDYGFGLIDALESVYAVLEGDPPISLSSSPSAIQFNSAVLSSALTLNPFPENETVTITDLTPGAPWLSASVEDPEQPLQVNVVASPDGLDPEGRFVTELVVSYDPDNGAADTLAIPVSLQLGADVDDKNAGRHYILLINADDEEAEIQQTIVTATDGRYRFEFDDIEPANYFLVAGTDTDNNGLICENGEACAEYPVNGLPETIRLGDDPQNGVRLNTSFRRPTISAMGMPRVGFEGYRVKSEASDQPELTKEYAP
ncbi:S8 family peptidase [Marinobacter sp. CHS3-4]|uniref:S8 family peptidase n=1 Tax=Marinobacter sp. CHS3-4 TaxID=3045174 RepID=UPI0024B5FBFC|nr:S8 family peptidase [Marinobacter sp. CHS3-4]MDI9244846.1 S8 family peptidase [Marinobacter sp. CHS3-4]